MFMVCVWYIRKKDQPVENQPADLFYGYTLEKRFLLFHAERLLSYHCAIGEDVNVISSGRQIFFYLPVNGHILLFSGVFYVFLDRISQVAVLVWECV